MFELTMNRLDGQPESLSKYEGQVIMLVNVASKCGLTPQYTGLQAMYDRYRDRVRNFWLSDVDYARRASTAPVGIGGFATRLPIPNASKAAISGIELLQYAQL